MKSTLETKRQRINQRRIRHALRNYHCWIKFDDGWRLCGPIQYYVGRRSGSSVARVRIR